MGGPWRRAARRAAAVGVLLVVGGWPGPIPAAVAQDEPVTTATGGPDLASLDPVPDPVLDQVPVEPTRAVTRAEDALDAASSRRDVDAGQWLIAEAARQHATDDADLAAAALADADAKVRAATSTLAAEEAELTRRAAVQDERRADLAVEQAELRRVAAAVFTSAPMDEGSILGTWEDIDRGEQREAMRHRVVDLQVRAVDRRAGPWRAARDAADAQRARRDAAADRLGRRRAEQRAAATERSNRLQVQAARERAAEDRRDRLDAAQRRRDATLDDLHEARLGAQVEGLDLSLVALHAYWEASGAAPCTVPWWVLAGIGRVESHHGTAQGSRVTVEGDTTVTILGIPLDGRPGTAAIADSDGGLIDHDATWDRAVGPMQFLPGTWRTVGVDADDDGVVDPNNLNDAAGGAARLLCLRHGDLTTEAAQRAALLTYNASVAYGTEVLSWGHRYRDALDLPDEPPEDPSGAADGAAGGD